ncbi:hypothetical protein [Candidatus Halocynthiibacter alkanivorans]|uniref:hypothetical protein n=1 Tax=Candidatus Halocynthiibacter alkanivorans TaxID=2267619 RepID=UPI00109D7CE3|nr:hypothetical protein [Candidatus Halocynthiibacter alkanivorans]
MTNRNLETAEFIIPADLWPGDAQKMRAELVQWLSEQTSTPIVELGAEVDDPTVSALQLIVAATRRISGPPAVPGNIASTALARLAEPQHIESEAR